MKLSAEDRRAADRIPNVKTWAKSVPRYAFRLALLDVYLFKQHTDILSAFGYRRTTVDNPGWDRGVVLNILRAVVMFAPVGGFAAYGGPVMGGDGRYTGRDFEGFSGDTAVTVVMWCFIIAMAGPAIVAYRWWRHDRHWSGIDVAYLVSAVVLGAICLGNLAVVNGVDVLYLEAPSVPVWLTAVSAAVLLAVCGLASKGRHHPVKRHFRSVGPVDAAKAAELIAKLTPKQRDTLLERRRSALRKLRDRGVIDETESSRVEAMPLGTSVSLDE